MSAPRHKYVAARPAPGTPLQKLGPRKWAYHEPVSPYSSLGRLVRRLLFLLLALIPLAALGLVGFKMWVDSQTQGLIYAGVDSEVPNHHVALVFGAGLNAEGGPSAMLYDRVATAVDLYNTRKVDKLLMTGDNSVVTHNEVEAMRKTAVDLGVPDEDIVLDYAGFSTWDSCYRAREVFSLTDATLVTQRFHLPRALYTCKQLGIDSVGVASDRQPYPTSYNEVREIPALAITAWRMLTDHQPKFLGPKVNVDEKQSR
ncbi:MAG: vancomycin high temperature exclusion protein [Chloroflexia bacterium]